MIISDLSILEIISDERDIMGGAGVFTIRYTSAYVFQLAISVAQSGDNNNSLSNNGSGAVAYSSNVAYISQRT